MHETEPTGNTSSIGQGGNHGYLGTMSATAPIGAPTPAAARNRESVGSPWLMLAMATLGFAVNFWAWALISPLGPLFRDQGSLGSLSESDVALLVAVPVVVG